MFKLKRVWRQQMEGNGLVIPSLVANWKAIGLCGLKCVCCGRFVYISLSLSLYQQDQIMATNCQTSPVTTNNVSKPCVPQRRERERMKEMGEGEESTTGCVCVCTREEDEGDHLGYWKVEWLCFDVFPCISEHGSSAGPNNHKSDKLWMHTYVVALMKHY